MMTRSYIKHDLNDNLLLQNKNGVDDLVLLDNITEGEIVNTLKRRYEADLIYVSERFKFNSSRKPPSNSW